MSGSVAPAFAAFISAGMGAALFLLVAVVAMGFSGPTPVTRRVVVWSLCLAETAAVVMVVLGGVLFYLDVAE